MIRVLLAEDSAVTREYLAAALDEDPEIRVVGTARDGVEAVEQAESLRPDVILMDVHMPRMGGLEATRQIMSRAPAPIVLATAGFSRDETALGFEAIKAGALTVLDKPQGPDNRAARDLTRTVKLMAEVKVVRRWPRRERAEIPSLAGRLSGRKIRAIGIGASTGGPAALAEALGGLGDVLAVPVLVVQHITPGFTAGLAEWLASQTRLPVKLAENGERAREGVVYLAPDGIEMGMEMDGRIRLTAQNLGEGLHPSADHLFASLARALGPSVLGILLTGMGRDGAEGLGQLRAAGAVTVAQDEATSVVFGMPGEALRRGAAEHVLSPREIAGLIRSLTEPERV
ncbi:MAG TPA: chemotaxis-specific protein-glutamate methyltransferase CheB [Vicinamibacteria bacterium]|nr:chemotaxis-specific protein-glutamate methyltransferase CheB [Vicinamibacteria bacterium]